MVDFKILSYGGATGYRTNLLIYVVYGGGFVFPLNLLSGGEIMEKYDGWIFKNKWGSLLSWTFAETKREVKVNVDNWKAWEREGHKIVKVKLVEVNDG